MRWVYTGDAQRRGVKAFWCAARAALRDRVHVAFRCAQTTAPVLLTVVPAQAGIQFARDVTCRHRIPLAREWREVWVTDG